MLHFGDVWTPVLWRKIIQNLLTFTFIYVFISSKIRRTGFRKAPKGHECCVAESYPNPLWMAFLMLYCTLSFQRLVYNIISHFKSLVLAWSGYTKIGPYQRSVMWIFRIKSKSNSERLIIYYKDIHYQHIPLYLINVCLKAIKKLLSCYKLSFWKKNQLCTLFVNQTLFSFFQLRKLTYSNCVYAQLWKWISESER